MFHFHYLPTYVAESSIGRELALLVLTGWLTLPECSGSRSSRVESSRVAAWRRGEEERSGKERGEGGDMRQHDEHTNDTSAQQQQQQQQQRERVAVAAAVAVSASGRCSTAAVHCAHMDTNQPVHS